MSRFSKAFEAFLVDQRAASDFPMSVRYTDIKDPHFYMKQKFMLEARFSAEAWLEPEGWEDPETKAAVVKDVKAKLVEQVFGEFRPMIIEMRAAMHDRDSVRLRTLLAEMEQKMFNE